MGRIYGGGTEMLIGWIVMGGALIGGCVANQKSKERNKQKGHATYTDSCGKMRYVDNDKLWDPSYDSLKKGDEEYYSTVRIYDGLIEKAKLELENVKKTGNTFQINACERHINHLEEKRLEEIEKAKQLKDFCKDIDEAERKRLRKHGYDI